MEPENRLSQKKSIVFQPSILQIGMLVIQDNFKTLRILTPSKVAILRIQTPVIEVQTLPVQRILRRFQAL